MRHFILFLLLSAGFSLQAQEILFDKTIPENEIPQASRLQTDLSSHYISSRYVRQADFIKAQDFFIVLSTDLVVKSKFHRIHQYPTGSFSYEGKLEGTIGGDVSFSRFNDRTAGMIVLQDGRKYMIDQVGPSLFAISLSKDDIFSQRETQTDFIIPPSEGLRSSAVAAGICEEANTCNGPSVIDLMVVYTAQAETSWGGNSNTIANITQAVTNMNISMTNSGVSNVSFRLVHTEKVTYTESGDFGTDLSRLAGTSDGFMDNVHTLRNQYGADLVSLIIGSPTSSCGIGYLNTSSTSYSANSGFNVSLYSCVVSNYTMAHECGHNMGLRHDWYVDGSSTPCSHHHGYVNQPAIAQGTSSPSSARWRTIMAYNNQCADAGFSCTRLNRWSNPSVLYNGSPTGVAIGSSQPSDEAFAYYRMACLVAAFRPEASSCATPSGLSASSITTSSATVSWSAISGANSYDVDYKTSASGVWINAVTATTSTSVNLSSLTSATVYDWRVRANCSSANSNYAQSQFTTQSPPTCNAPSGLGSSNITSSSATVSWNTVSGALNYDVDYKVSTSLTWINAVTATTSLSANLGGLTASTLYDWRVRANCSSLTSGYSTSQFTTSAAASPCPGIYDNSTNGTTTGAAIVPLNTDIKGTIGTKGDNDHYRFFITTGGTITVSLTTLPANYQLALLNSSGTQLNLSQNNGTANETINATVAAGTYYARVFPKGNVSSSSCYTLRIQTGTATDVMIAQPLTAILFPNPAGSMLNVWTDGQGTKTLIRVYDAMGKMVMQQSSTNKITQLDISGLAAGYYLMNVSDGIGSKALKFIKE
jgi:hypothetical protein